MFHAVLRQDFVERRQAVQVIVESRRAEVAALCQRFHVRRLELFGSAASGPFDPARSDFDFLVEFERSPEARPFDDYFGLKEALESLLARPVDLVMADAVANPYLRASIERTRVTVYAS